MQEIEDLKFENEQLRTAVRLAAEHAEAVHAEKLALNRELDPAYARRLASIRSFVRALRVVKCSPGLPDTDRTLQAERDDWDGWEQFLKEMEDEANG